MRNALLYLSALLLLPYNVSNAQNRSTLLTKVEMKEDLQILKTNLESVHTGLYTYTSKEKFDSLFANIYANLNQAAEPIAFYRKLLPIIQAIRNNHTNIHPPQSYLDRVNTTAARFPLRLYYRADTLYVLEDMSGLDTVPAGSTLLSINGIDAMTTFKRMTSLRSTDGFNKTFPNWSISYAFSRYYAYYIGIQPYYLVKIRCKDGSIKEFKLNAPSVIELKEMGKRLSNSIKKANYGFEIVDNIALLRIKTFQPDPAREYLKVLKNAFSEIRAQNTSHLILDLRGNGGGFPEATYKLLQYLILEPINPIKIEYAITDHIQNPEHFIKEPFYKHFHRQKFAKKDSIFQVRGVSNILIKPHKLAFKGKLYLLTNAASASATGDLIGQLQSHCNPTFIGEEAGGNAVTQTANDLLKLILPNSGLKITLPAIKTIMNVNFTNNGHSIIPQHQITPTIDQYLNNRDVVLEFARELAKSKQVNK